MRQLDGQELVFVNGAEDHSVVVVDPLAAVQTFLYIISVTDQKSFAYGSVVTGMTAGLLGGAYTGYTLAATGLSLTAVGCGLGGAAVGAFAGGLTFKVAALGLTSMYNVIMA